MILAAINIISINMWGVLSMYQAVCYMYEMCGEQSKAPTPTGLIIEQILIKGEYIRHVPILLSSFYHYSYLFM